MLAEGKGFEPSIQFPVYWFSKPEDYSGKSHQTRRNPPFLKHSCPAGPAKYADRGGTYGGTVEEKDMACPVEIFVEGVLRRAGVKYERDRELSPGQHSIDFYLPDQDLWIEVCQFHTPRKIEQLSRLPDVVLVQGFGAAKGLGKLLDRSL